MKVLMVSLDRKAFSEGDPARVRLAGYGTVFGELHIIVYAKRSLGLKDERIADNVWLHPTNSRSRFFYVTDAIHIAIRRFRTDVPDIVSGQDVGETGLAVWLIARRLRVPLQLQDHADVFDPWFARESLGNRLRVRIARFLIPKADCVRVVLEPGRMRIAQAFPQMRERISVLPVYTPLDLLMEGHASFDLHERYPQFSQIFLMASRLVPQKDIRFALRAFARADIEGAGLLIVGEGRLLGSLVTEANALGIGEKVVFVPWEKDLISYYLTADLFLLSSRYESYCRTLVEAAASGLPFVSTDVGIARALVEHGAKGTVLAHDDLEGFASALKNHAESGTIALREPGGLEAVTALTGKTEEEYRDRYRATLAHCVMS